MKNKWQEQLHSLLNCDLKSLYPLARTLNRRLHFFVGPTNSGKTYTAMQKLQDADCGVYLAPLRLLALEGYQSLVENGFNSSLITGEEHIYDEEATHICSTIEMVDFNMDLDVAVIDEVQMLDDEDRGWAWINAILGAPARDVYMTGSVNALEAIKKIASYLDEELNIVKFKRKNPLKVNAKATQLNNLRPGTALIAFSRSEVLSLKAKLSRRHKVSVIYGNLSPEVRRDEARRFRHKESDILIATDAIAMGLNLPIETILFTNDRKFDGKEKRKITPNEVIQIAGRAGRYGIFDIGFVGGVNNAILEHIRVCMETPIKTIKPPFKVKATNEQIEALSGFLETKSISAILGFFAKNMKFDGPFRASNISSMLQIANIIDKKENLSLDDKYLLANAPIYLKSKLVASAFEVYISGIIKKRVVNYKPSITLKRRDVDEKDLLLVEDEVKKISLYLWLSYKLPNIFPDYDKAVENRKIFNDYIEQTLKSSKLNSTNRKEEFQKRAHKKKINHKFSKPYKN